MSTNDTEQLSYSQDAQITTYLFFQDLNDINIFVEDAEKEFEYEEIFKRLFKDEYKITKIIATGGKPRLIDAFSEFGTVNENNTTQKNIYIADGDFDRYNCPESMINNTHFIYLEKYNIESYFIDKSASEKFTKGYLKCLDATVTERLKFSEWKNNIIQQASKLFFVYMFVNKNFPHVATLSRSPYEYLNHDTGLEISGAYETYFDEVLKLDCNAKDKISEIKALYYSQNSDNGESIICGKFLFSSLTSHIKNVIKKPIKNDDFRWHLICNFDISNLYYLKEKIDYLMRAENELVLVK